MTRPRRVVDGAERCHRAGLDAERLAHQLGRAEREAAGRRRAAGAAILRSIAASSSAVTRNSASFLSLAGTGSWCGRRESAPRSACDCSTVNSGGWRHRRMRDAEAVEGGKSSSGVAGMPF